MWWAVHVREGGRFHESSAVRGWGLALRNIRKAWGQWEVVGPHQRVRSRLITNGQPQQEVFRRHRRWRATVSGRVAVVEVAVTVRQHLDVIDVYTDS